MSGQRIEQISKRAKHIRSSSGWEMSEAGSMEYEAFRIADQDVFYLVRRLEESEAENQRLRASLEKREEHLAEVRRGGEWFPESGEVVERRIPPAGAAF